MSDYKYPYIPKEYYPAVMYACSCIRKYGTFNVACKAAAQKYGVDEDEIAKHVRKRQGAGQKGQTRKYKFFVAVGWEDHWYSMGDFDILWSQYEPEDWKTKRRKVANVIKATSRQNAEERIPKGRLDRNGTMTGFCLTDYTLIEFQTEKEANQYIKELQGAEA